MQYFSITRRGLRPPCPSRLLSAAAFASILAVSPAWARGAPGAAIAELQEELASLKESQAETRAKIMSLEATLQSLAGEPVRRLEPTGGARAEVTEAQPAAPALDVSGDVRLRFEANLENEDLPYRGREVVRARVSARYAVGAQTLIGARLVTGDANDPNTTDVTLSSFNDNLDVSLDQLFIQRSLGDWSITGGKFPNPLSRTELVWDGDVNLQGLSIDYNNNLASAGSIGFSAVYFIIDEAAFAANSEMLGLQGRLTAPIGSDWEVSAAVGYYDYSLQSLAGADAGDFRSNYLTAEGAYLSDFDLLDAIGTLTYRGLGDRWPLRAVVNYVINLGAETPEDSGIGIDVFAGELDQTGDYRFVYGYAEAETDAVLAAFSHDNLNLATNYRQHTFGVDYALRDGFLLNATAYRYRPLKSGVPGISQDWQTRIRFNLMFSF